ncbi:unnamed protein product [Colias eurytheme]|nr:unnamed protein product [Colias eurytheme]
MRFVIVIHRSVTVHFVALQMYSGALLATAARLAWDPSTYTWFRFLAQAQYRVSTGYVLGAGLWLAALVYLAAAALRPPRRAAPACLNTYAVGVAVLAASEVAYGAWMAASLAEWWRSAPQAELARHGMDLLHDIKPALLAIDRYRDVARPIYDMIEEVEARAPNNAVVIAVFGLVALILQIAAFIMARRLACAARARPASAAGESGKAGGSGSASDADSDSERDLDSPRKPPGWHKSANLRIRVDCRCMKKNFFC